MELPYVVASSNLDQILKRFILKGKRKHMHIFYMPWKISELNYNSALNIFCSRLLFVVPKVVKYSDIIYVLYLISYDMDIWSRCNKSIKYKNC